MEKKNEYYEVDQKLMKKIAAYDDIIFTCWDDYVRVAMKSHGHNSNELEETKEEASGEDEDIEDDNFEEDEEETSKSDDFA